jgi:hypothetical protein
VSVAESDADTYYAVKAVEARQLAWLTAQFYEALLLGNLSADLAHDITLSWFEYELAESEMTIDDD